MNNNHITIIGNMTKDPTQYTMQSGSRVVNFTVAVYRNEKVTDYINCAVWNDLGDFVLRNCKKGNQVTVIGRLQIDKSNKDGKYYAQIRADYVGRSEWKRNAGDAGASEAKADYSQFAQEMADEIPF